jgi:hypothetical protein
MRQDETVALPDPGVVIGTTRNHAGDGVADQVVVAAEIFPGHRVLRAQRFPGEFADDRDLTAQFAAHRLEPAAAAARRAGPIVGTW